MSNFERGYKNDDCIDIILNKDIASYSDYIKKIDTKEIGKNNEKCVNQIADILKSITTLKKI